MLSFDSAESGKDLKRPPALVPKYGGQAEGAKDAE